MSAAFVPTFTRALTRDGRDSAWRLGNNVVNTLLVVTGLLVLAGMIFAEPLVSSRPSRRTTATSRASSS
jgi:putative peptidoglycan lipid II flippase